MILESPQRSLPPAPSRKARESHALRRRGLGQAAALAAVASMLPPPARAKTSPAPNVIVYCDPALRAAIEDAGRLFTASNGARVNVFCAAPTLMLAQIERVVQNDVLVTQADWMDEAVRRALIKPSTRMPLGANRLVLAVSGQATALPLTDRVAIRRLIGAGPVAIPDPTTGTTVDSAGTLARLGFSDPLPFKTVGAIDTEGVAFLIRTGAAKLGLLYRTEAQAGSGLAPVALLPDESPVPYAAAITVLTRRPNAEAFMDFLHTPDATSRLTSAGLEAVA